MVRCIVLSLAVIAAVTVTTRAAEEKDRRKIPDAAQAILEKAESFELFSLDPEELKEAPKNDFHGWRVLGKTTVKEADIRRKLVKTLEEAVSTFKGEPAKCFNPRHGIRVTHGGKTADFVICFECSQTRVTVQGQERQTFLVSPTPAGVFDAVLKKAGVVLPRTAGEK